MHAVLLARVSSKEQEDGHSLVAQLDRLHAYCLRKNLDIIQEFTLVESSTRGERPEFQKMIAYIKKQSGKVALVCDKVDRLQRSFREVPILEQLRKSDKLVLHFVSENQILDSGANNSQIMAYQIFVMMAENYTNCISDNVKRSFEKKIREGTILTCAPIGYLNTTINGARTAIIDPERGHKVRMLFEKYATRNISIRQLADYATEIGLKTKRNKPISPSQMHLILCNPFYYGEMKIKGKLYPHCHDRLITKEIFDLCDKIRSGKYNNVSRKKKKDMLLSGFVHCVHCGKSYSPYLAKGRYVFLKPPKSDTCRHYHVSAAPFMKQINEILSALHFGPSRSGQMIKGLQEKQTKAILEKDRYIATQNETLSKLAIKKSRLTELYLDQGISRDEYDTIINDISKQQQEIRDQMVRTDDRIGAFYANLIKCAKIAEISHFLFKSSNFCLKRLILKLISSNLFLDNKNAVISIRYPFVDMVQKGHRQIWGG